MRRLKFTNSDSGHKEFYLIMNARVNDYFKNRHLSIKANSWMLFKIALLLILFFSTYLIIISGAISGLAIVSATIFLGFISALIGFNIAHDAAHGALFRSEKMNRLFSYSFELIGLSNYAWKLKHNIIHHNNPNVMGADFDIEAGPVLRLSPADKVLPFHKYQHLYAPIVYLLFSLILVFVNDFKIISGNKREEIDGKKHQNNILPITVFFKSVYLFMMLLLPYFLLPYSFLEVLAAFLMMYALLSVLMAFVLIPSHLFEDTCFGGLNESGKINGNWALHQMMTTLDYSRKSRVCNWLLGGLNINIVHHLFPGICHIHLIPVSDIIKSCADEYHIRYNEMSMGEAMVSHFKILKQLGRGEK